MILYHGTNCDFCIIDIKKSNPYKDFGRGFYLTSLLEQAQNLASKRSRIYGGSPIVQEYEFDESILETSNLNILVFDGPTAEWAEFIYKNRNKEACFHHSYDIVVGPIADDGVAYLLNRYEEGTYTIQELARELKYKKLNNQYFFGTQRAIEQLRRL